MSSLASSRDPEGQIPRAKFACKACHQRRVKCDASGAQPCWHCHIRKIPCELFQSKRGRYPRKRKAKSDHGSASSTNLQRSYSPGDRGSALSTRLESSYSPGEEVPVQNETIMGQTFPEHISGPKSFAGQDHTFLPGPKPAVSSQLMTESEDQEGPEMLYARISEPETAQSSQGQTTANGRSYYLGDSFSLSYLVRTVCRPPADEHDAVKMHYAVPPSVADHPITPCSTTVETTSPIGNAFFALERSVSDELVRLYFSCFHPGYPVLDREDFTNAYDRNKASLLLLHTIYFLALSICSEETLVKAGYTDRATAKRTHYLRAKALYDADHETDRTIVVAVLFLLGFWWAGPEDQKDTWHWLGSAISLAQTLGMHRSTALSGMGNRQQSIWRRMWWCIYIRDRVAAGALGRPSRIHDRDCDVEMVMDSDLWVDDGYNKSLIEEQQPFHVSYFIELSKLAEIFGDILAGEFSPKRSKIYGYDPKSLALTLTTWRSQLPFEMRRAPLDGTLGAAWWASMLHALFHLCEILLFRPTRIEPQSIEERAQDAQARMATDAITRIAEDLLADGTIIYGQLHLVPTLFCALSIHTIVSRRKDPVQRQLAENKSRQCLLALSELSKSWPVGGWILRFFLNLTKRLNGYTGYGDNSNSSGIQPAAQRQDGSTLNSSGSSQFGQSDQRAPALAELEQSSLSMHQQQADYGFQLPADAVFTDALWAEDSFGFDLFQNPMEPFFSTFR